MPPNEATSDVVLLGVGHTNAHVLREWRDHPPANARLTCVSLFATATYSGMLSGVLAGQYAPERMTIDLASLCASAGTRLIIGSTEAIDRDRRLVHVAGHPPLPYDFMSIGIGSIPNQAGVSIKSGDCVSIKPMQTFLDRIRDAIARNTKTVDQRAIEIGVVGGGAGGAEIACCLPAFVEREWNRPTRIGLIEAGASLLPGMSRRAARMIRQVIESRGGQVLLGARVTRVTDEGVKLEDGRDIPVDVVIWAGGAAADPFLATIGLPTDDAGFLLTRSTLASIGDDRFFVVGDAGTIDGRPVPKAGVYAVRQGPILWENIRRSLEGRPLVDYRPQRGFLKLLNTGDGRAVGEYKGLALHAGWLWRLKDRIDSRFVDRYQRV